MFQKRRDAVGEFGVGRLFPEMTPRQPGPTSGLKVRFTNDRGRCDRSAEFANSVRPFLIHGVVGISGWLYPDRKAHPNAAPTVPSQAAACPGSRPGSPPAAGKGRGYCTPDT